MTNMPIAIMAPEFPALTTASTSPRFIISKADLHRRIFFPQRNARRFVHGHDLRCGDDLKLRRAEDAWRAPARWLRSADQNQLDAKLLRRKQQHPRSRLPGRGLRPSHRWRFSAWEVRRRLTFFGLDDRAAAIKAAMGASAMGQDGFAAIGAGAPLRLGQIDRASAAGS